MHEFIACQHQPAELEDEVQEGALQLPAAGLPGVPAAHGRHQRVLPQVDHAGGQGGKSFCSYIINN